MKEVRPATVSYKLGRLRRRDTWQALTDISRRPNRSFPARRVSRQAIDIDDTMFLWRLIHDSLDRDFRFIRFMRSASARSRASNARARWMLQLRWESHHYYVRPHAAQTAAQDQLASSFPLVPRDHDVYETLDPAHVDQFLDQDLLHQERALTTESAKSVEYSPAKRSVVCGVRASTLQSRLSRRVRGRTAHPS